MAIYFVNVRIISRGAARTSTGASAYRAGERIYDERTGQTFDYTRRRGEIETEIMAPAVAPEWVHDRERLWNAVEMGEKRCDAQLAREMVVAFPIELNPDQQRELIRGYVQEQFVSLGMVADVAIHRNLGNPHAHIMLTMREMTPEGFAAKKNRDWNRPEMLERWRAEWANHANRALERAGREERIDHRRLVDQGSERLPQVHLGPHAAAIERRGISAIQGDHNRLVAEHNGVVIELEQAREEKRRLEAAKAVNGRHAARMASGWTREHSVALGELEWATGGKPLTSDEVSRIQQEHHAEISHIGRQIEQTVWDDLRLRRAESIMDKRDKAALDVDRLKSPMAVVKRWFSAEARTEFRDAQGSLNHLNEQASIEGVISRADLDGQKAACRERADRIPELEEKRKGHQQTLGRAVSAKEGFQEEFSRKLRERPREMTREPEFDPTRERNRSRGIDRGR